MVSVASSHLKLYLVYNNPHTILVTSAILIVFPAITMRFSFITARNEVGGKVMFLHVCVILFTVGACVGGMCGRRGACVVVGGHVCLRGAWWGGAWLGACMVAGGMRGCWRACMVVRACMVAGGHAWLQGACVVARGWGVVHAWLQGVCMVGEGHVWLLGSVCGC